MRFDDSLKTVLAADTHTAFGVRSAWRQLVDLVARGRVDDVDSAIDRLRQLRDRVPADVRRASARMIAEADPPAVLVELFAADDIAVAAPVIRNAALPERDWLALLPRLSPAARAVLRHRRDLPAAVTRGLDSFGATDFVLADDRNDSVAPATPLAAPLDETPFVAIGEAARNIPVVARVLGQAGEPAPRFEIAELVARIDAYQRTREAPTAVPSSVAEVPPDRFDFATDAAGVIRWVEGVARTPLIGVSLALASPQGAAQVDAGAGGALRRRSAFRDVRLIVTGGSTAAGQWRLAGRPCFEAASGRFTGMHGVARRLHEEAPGATAVDQLRQLVHELRTPATAIAGFAELIGSELLGPVAPLYRDRASAIQRQAADLLGAIEDLDIAARIEGDALDLRPEQVDLTAVARDAVAALSPVAAERGVDLTVEGDLAPALADDRAVRRLVTRLLATLVQAAGEGERLRLQTVAKPRTARLAITRPRTLQAMQGDALLAIDADADREDAPLLGTGFALRLARTLAKGLGGKLVIEEDRLTLRLPVAHAVEVERAAMT